VNRAKDGSKIVNDHFSRCQMAYKKSRRPPNYHFSFILESATHFPRHSKPLAQIKTQLEQSHEAIWKQVERKVWQHLGPLLQKIIASLKTKQPKKYISLSGLI
jgi:hypothetical protein